MRDDEREGKIEEGAMMKGQVQRKINIQWIYESII